jgi:hypothetical protein
VRRVSLSYLGRSTPASMPIAVVRFRFGSGNTQFRHGDESSVSNAGGLHQAQRTSPVKTAPRAGPCGGSAASFLASDAPHAPRRSLSCAVRVVSRRARQDGYAPFPPATPSVNTDRLFTFGRSDQGRPWISTFNSQRHPPEVGKSRREVASALRGKFYRIPAGEQRRVPGALHCMARSRRQGRPLRSVGLGVVAPPLTALSSPRDGRLGRHAGNLLRPTERSGATRLMLFRFETLLVCCP